MPRTLDEGTQRDIIATVFPELRHGDDPDLERYLELRKEGKVAAALGLYNGPLRARYPVDSTRVLLISLRRARDPRWRDLQARLLAELAEHIRLRTLGNIDTLLSGFPASAMGGAWGALGAADGLLRRLGCVEDPERARDLLQRHLDLAKLVEPGPHRAGGRVRLLEKATDLLREYAALSSMEDPGEQDFVARSNAIEDRRRSLGASGGGASRWRETGADFVALSRARAEAEREGRRSRFFDLEHIRIGAKDRALIEMAAPPERHEDLVLAWCFKYWRLALDPAFGRSVFLYSGKYGTRHFEIYRNIRDGRLRGRSDDEILTSLSGLLATGYSYSVSGDLYMQARWRRLKAGRYEAEAASIARAPAADGSGDRESAGREAMTAPDPTHLQEIREQGPSTSVRDEGLRGRSEKTGPRPEPARPPKEPELHTRVPDPLPRTKAFQPLGEPSGHRLQAGQRPKEALASLPSKSSGGSISDRIKRLSGRQYDVHRDLFLAKVRDDIRRRLLRSRTRPAGLFDTSANEAEDAVYEFISSRYEDPFLDWESSRERALVEGLGFNLGSLDGIIEDCWKRIA